MDGDTTSATLLEMAATRAIAHSAGIGERLVASLCWPLCSSVRAPSTVFAPRSRTAILATGSSSRHRRDNGLDERSGQNKGARVMLQGLVWGPPYVVL